jgi:hypothetical protein
MLRTWLSIIFLVATVCFLLRTVVDVRQKDYGFRQLYRSITTRKDDHSEIIDVLTELLGLLDDLAAIEPGSLLYPQPDTGVHAPGTINTIAASIAGYSSQAIKPMCSLPYLQDPEFRVGPSTHMMSYAQLDEGGFDSERAMYIDGEEDVMPPSAVQITAGESIYGVWRIYDADKSKATTHHLKERRHLD